MMKDEGNHMTAQGYADQHPGDCNNCNDGWNFNAMTGAFQACGCNPHHHPRQGDVAVINNYKALHNKPGVLSPAETFKKDSLKAYLELFENLAL